MRKLVAIATLSIVGVLTFFHVASAADCSSSLAAGAPGFTNLTITCITTFTDANLYVGNFADESSLLGSIGPFAATITREVGALTNGVAFDGWYKFTNSDIFDFRWDGFDLITSNEETNTHIVSIVSPLDESATSTSVLFSGYYYAKRSDFSFSTFDIVPRIELLITNLSNNATSSINDSVYLRQTITSFDQVVYFATTTVLRNNSRYAWSFKIYGTSATNGQNVYFTSSMPGGKLFYQFTTGVFDSTQGLSFDLSSCNVISGFDMNDCLYNLLFPNNVVYPVLFGLAKESYGRAFPIGYVTRFYEILSTTSTLSLPTISYTPGSTSPLFATFNGDPIEFDPFGAIANADSPLNFKSDQAIQKSFWVIVDEPLRYLLYITLLFLIIKDVTGLMKHRN